MLADNTTRVSTRHQSPTWVSLVPVPLRGGVRRPGRQCPHRRYIPSAARGTAPPARRLAQRDSERDAVTGALRGVALREAVAVLDGWARATLSPGGAREAHKKGGQDGALACEEKWLGSRPAHSDTPLVVTFPAFGTRA